ncbi:MAG: hypothetical protein JW833_14460 [Prolixibacteraceae bacterium]|nr:hypothetical protein [Prolixibacteraceae bacterium]
MKTQETKNLAKKIGLFFFAFLMVSPFMSHAKKVVFLNSSVVPSANGYIKVKKDNNKNFVVKIQVNDLAEISQLQNSKLTYVAWMETDHGNTENLGQLKSSTGFLSKRHKASLETISSYKPVKIFITSEDDINVQYPGRQVVLTTDNF